MIIKEESRNYGGSPGLPSHHYTLPNYQPNLSAAQHTLYRGDGGGQRRFALFGQVDDGEKGVAESSAPSSSPKCGRGSRQRLSLTRSRVSANVRERRRTAAINNAFESLRKRVPQTLVPSSSAKRSATKIGTLTMAAHYIQFLNTLLRDQEATGSDVDQPRRQRHQIPTVPDQPNHIRNGSEGSYQGSVQGDGHVASDEFGYNVAVLEAHLDSAPQHQQYSTSAPTLSSYDSTNGQNWESFPQTEVHGSGYDSGGFYNESNTANTMGYYQNYQCDQNYNYY